MPLMESNRAYAEISHAPASTGRRNSLCAHQLVDTPMYFPDEGSKRTRANPDFPATRHLHERGREGGVTPRARKRATKSESPSSDASSMRETPPEVRLKHPTAAFQASNPLLPLEAQMNDAVGLPARLAASPISLATRAPCLVSLAGSWRVGSSIKSRSMPFCVNNSTTSNRPSLGASAASINNAPLDTGSPGTCAPLANRFRTAPKLAPFETAHERSAQRSAALAGSMTAASLSSLPLAASTPRPISATPCRNPRSDSCKLLTAGTLDAIMPPWLALATDTKPMTVTPSSIATATCQAGRRHSGPDAESRAPNPIADISRAANAGASADINITHARTA